MALQALPSPNPRSFRKKPTLAAVAAIAGAILIVFQTCKRMDETVERTTQTRDRKIEEMNRKLEEMEVAEQRAQAAADAARNKEQVPLPEGLEDLLEEPTDSGE